MYVSFVIVNYRSKNFLLACLSSLFSCNFSFDYEIIIVNNSPEVDNFSFSEPNISIIPNDNKNGFGYANNLGAAKANGDLICFLNPDTLFMQNQKILTLLELFKNNSIGVVGPKLVSDQKLLTPQLWSTGTEITLWDIIKNNLGIPASRTIWESSASIPVAWVSGAALFIRKNLFVKINGFDEKFFMYFEDVDLCKRVSLIGKKVLYYPEYAIFHWSGKSHGDNFVQKKMYYESQDYYFKKYFTKLDVFFLKVLRKFSLFIKNNSLL